MKVRELIELLQKINLDAQVICIVNSPDENDEGDLVDYCIEGPVAGVRMKDGRNALIYGYPC